jgi:hypothetical protein
VDYDDRRRCLDPGRVVAAGFSLQANLAGRDWPCL